MLLQSPLQEKRNVRLRSSKGSTSSIRSTFFWQLFKDKNGNYSLRELATLLIVLSLIASWIAKQFFNKDIPDYMFFSFSSLVGAGCFGYSIEKKSTPTTNS